jgi:signal transduction histidine kinase
MKDLVVASTNELLDPREISRNTVSLIGRLFNVSNAYILFENQNYDTALVDENDVKSQEKLFEIIKGLKSKDIFIKDELDLIRNNRERGIELLIELMKSNNLYAVYSIGDFFSGKVILCIGNKRNNAAFLINELEIFHFIKTNLKNAFIRSELHHEIKMLNKSLKDRIDKATEELQDKYKELKIARAKERDMLDIMGHELRTPLSIIKIALGALKMKIEKNRDNFDAEIFETYEPRISDALEREIKLLETMLTSTKIDSARIELDLEKVDLGRVIKDAVLAHKKKASQKGLDIKVKGDIKKEFVYADKVRLGEVMDNLVSNAVKYTDKGGVIISVSEVEAENSYRISITDTGPGIPEDAIPRLGEKFFRVDQYLNNKGEVKSSENGRMTAPEIVRPGGTGLGLYVSFGLVKLMGGNIAVASKLGEGSTFSFSIPKYSGQKEVDKNKKDKNLFTRLGLSDEN